MMSQTIAVVCDAAGKMQTLSEAAQVMVYRQTPQGWQPDGAVPVALGSDPIAMRAGMETLAAALDDCRILAGKKVEGIAYHCLNRLGFAIFEIDCLTDNILDEMLSDVQTAQQPAMEAYPSAPWSPQNDGHYQLDLIRLQKEQPDISSKKAFRSFLETGTFLSFTLTCSHIPPWAEDMAKDRKLTMAVETLAGGVVRVTFTSGCCAEAE